jgi:hypothetical protein
MAQAKAHAPTRMCAFSFLGTPASQLPKRFLIFFGGEIVKVYEQYATPFLLEGIEQKDVESSPSDHRNNIFQFLAISFNQVVFCLQDFVMQEPHEYSKF